MILKHFLWFMVSCLALSEMRPLKSISEDMGIIVRCNATSPVNKHTLNVALVERRFEPNINRNFKCFLHCLYYNYEWMDSSGKFKPHAMKLGLSESTLGYPAIDYLVQTCTDIGNEDKCERAFAFTQCFWTENEKLEASSSSEWQWMNRWY